MNLLEDKKDKTDELQHSEAGNKNKISQKVVRRKTKQSTVEGKFYINMRRTMFLKRLTKQYTTDEEKKDCPKRNEKYIESLEVIVRIPS